MKEKRETFNYNLKRICILSLDDVLPLLSEGEPAGVYYDENKKRTRVKKQRIQIKGHEVGVNSLRLVTFKVHGIACVNCGITGGFFAVEQTAQGVKENKSHLNLYAINVDGKEVMMTHDHVIPRSKGGKDALGNTQTMCVICNGAKGSIYPSEE